jgi:hypothetical protein
VKYTNQWKNEERSSPAGKDELVSWLHDTFQTQLISSQEKKGKTFPEGKRPFKHKE